jgi:opacity protein-like surface antigen
MKTFVYTVVIAAALAAPALSQAQAQDSMPATQSQQSNAMTSGYGGTAAGKDQAGSQQKGTGFLHRSYDGARGDNCVGPISYCNIFFGS